MGNEAADPPAVALLLGIVRGLRRGGWGVDATRATAWYGVRVARVVAQALGAIAGGR
jgi:predicted Rossmann fold nucleotide-binding protein DprA/Smf involved in DNA uptake